MCYAQFLLQGLVHIVTVVGGGFCGASRGCGGTGFTVRRLGGCRGLVQLEERGDRELDIDSGDRNREIGSSGGGGGFIVL